MAARPKARLAFGSCSKADTYPVQPAWKSIADRGPSHLMLLGDQMYMDFGGTLYQPAKWPLARFRDEMHRRYAQQWAVAEMRAFLDGAKLPPENLLAVWDDHDFAWNNAVGGQVGPKARNPYKVDQPHRDVSEALARQYYDVLRTRPAEYPPVPTDFPAARGLNAMSVVGDAPVFLLDTRSFRDHESGGTACLGPAQERWLAAALGKIDPAQPVIIASGVTLAGGKRLDHEPSWLERYYGRHIAETESWRDSGAAVTFLSGALAGRKVLWLSGDIHVNAFVSHPLPGSGWPLHEGVSSGLAVRGYKFGWWGEQRNFGILDLHDDRWEICLHRGIDGTARTVVIDVASWQAR